MDVSVDVGSVDLGGYKTPLDKLAKRFKISLELWKDKYREAKRTIKRYQNQANDAQRSRDGWKEKARHWKQRATLLQASTERLQAELDRLRTESPGSKSKQTTAR